MTGPVVTEKDIVVILEASGLSFEDWNSATELVIDSLTYFWLTHLLEERHGILIEPRDEEAIAASGSIGELHRKLVALVPAAEPKGRPA